MAQVSGLAKSDNYDPLAAAPRRHFLPVHMMCDERPNSCRAYIGLVCGFRKRSTVPGGLVENYPRCRIALRPQPLLLPVVLKHRDQAAEQGIFAIDNPEPTGISVGKLPQLGSH